MEFKLATIAILTILLIFNNNNNNNINCQICQPTTTTYSTTTAIIQHQQTDFSFCCCRNVRTITTVINSNTTINSYSVEFKINNINTIYQNITNLTTDLYNSNKHSCVLNRTVVSGDTNITKECHCSNTYNDLSQHRLLNVSTGYTCPIPQIIIGKFDKLDQSGADL